MRFTEDAWKKTVARLRAAYSVDGRDALAKMNHNEQGILYAEAMVDLREAKARHLSFPGELTRLRMEKAERDVRNIGTFLKEQEKLKKQERGMER